MSLMLLGILNSQAGGAGIPAFDLLETTTLTTSAASVTFSGLAAYAADYKHLQIRMVFRDTFNADYGVTGLRFNGDSNSNYFSHTLKADGAEVGSQSFGLRSYINIEGGLGANETPAQAFGSAVIDVLDAFSANQNTTIKNFAGRVGLNQTNVFLNSGLWMNTNALTSLTFFGSVSNANFIAGSRFSLIGIK
jgi:hypothetical protein